MYNPKLEIFVGKMVARIVWMFEVVKILICFHLNVNLNDFSFESDRRSRK